MTIVFGGAFNPPTNAHVEIARTLLNKFPESTLIFLPVGDDYQKPGLAPAHHRLAMLKLVCGRLGPRALVSNHEIKHPYQGTLSSLNALSKDFDQLTFVLGADHIDRFHTWRHVDSLLEAYQFIVFERDGSHTLENLKEKFPSKIHRFHVIPGEFPLSATEFRNNPKKNKEMVIPEVYNYIEAHHLYMELTL